MQLVLSLDQTCCCVVIPFPADKRVGKIQRVAQVLSERRGKGADAYWRRTVDDLRRSMERAGLDTEMIERELEAFRRAVAGRMTQPGGAA
ncbi:DUF6074 family protein [Ancylobacter sp. SL191]|uniref:DUF6074 family protein n=1 Tax=Ancylobacter sp. SL191 TaxID=2995166 RepID=UPI003B63BF40